ncbi:PGF-CTERM sorting domain-containing protein [Streptomyces krungchingensis]
MVFAEGEPGFELLAAVISLAAAVLMSSS